MKSSRQFGKDQETSEMFRKLLNKSSGNFREVQRTFEEFQVLPRSQEIFKKFSKFPRKLLGKLFKKSRKLRRSLKNSQNILENFQEIGGSFKMFRKLSDCSDKF